MVMQMLHDAGGDFWLFISVILRYNGSFPKFLAEMHAFENFFLIQETENFIFNK